MLLYLKLWYEKSFKNLYLFILLFGSGIWGSRIYKEKLETRRKSQADLISRPPLQSLTNDLQTYF